LFFFFTPLFLLVSVNNRLVHGTDPVRTERLFPPDQALFNLVVISFLMRTVHKNPFSPLPVHVFIFACVSARRRPIPHNPGPSSTCLRCTASIFPVPAIFPPFPNMYFNSFDPCPGTHPGKSFFLTRILLRNLFLLSCIFPLGSFLQPGPPVDDRSRCREPVFPLTQTPLVSSPRSRDRSR